VNPAPLEQLTDMMSQLTTTAGASSLQNLVSAGDPSAVSAVFSAMSKAMNVVPKESTEIMAINGTNVTASDEVCWGFPFDQIQRSNFTVVATFGIDAESSAATLYFNVDFENKPKN